MRQPSASVAACSTERHMCGFVVVVFAKPLLLDFLLMSLPPSLLESGSRLRESIALTTLAA